MGIAIVLLVLLQEEKSMYAMDYHEHSTKFLVGFDYEKS